MIAPASKPATAFSELMKLLKAKQASARAATGRGWSTLSRWWSGESQPVYQDVRRMVARMGVIEAMSILEDLAGKRFAIVVRREDLVLDRDGDGDVDLADQRIASLETQEHFSKQLRLVITAKDDGYTDEQQRHDIRHACGALQRSAEMIVLISDEMPLRPVRRAAKPLQLSGTKPREVRVGTAQGGPTGSSRNEIPSVPDATDAQSAARRFDGGAQ